MSVHGVTVETMNITEVALLTLDVFKIILPKDYIIFNIYDRSIHLAYRLSDSLSRLALHYIISFVHETLSFLLTILSVISIFLLVSLIKSIQPRYRLSNVDDDSAKVRMQHNSNLNHLSQERASKNIQILAENIARTKSTKNNVYVSNSQLPILTKFLNKFKEESIRLDQLCHPALTNVNIQSVQHHLSWSYSQPDVENLAWLNQTLQTLWPSIRTLLYKFFLYDLIQPRKSTAIGNNYDSFEIKKGNSKMSVYLSSRRKLNFLQRAKSPRSQQRHNRFLKRGLIALITYFLKLFLIYTKQFVMDNIVYIFKQPGDNVNSVANMQKLEFDLNSLISKISSRKISPNRWAESRSWAGFDLKSGNRDKLVKVRRKAKSASQETTGNKFNKVLYKSTTTLIKPTNSIEIWKKYQKLLKKFRLAQKKIKKKGTTIDRIRLGDSIPTVNAIKYLDGSTDFSIESNQNLFHSLASDDQNMRFIIELSFESDKHFEFQASSIPVLGRARLIDVSFQLRFLVTLNHTITELNGGNLEIFETPDDILFPAINHIQLALIDVPRLDWYLARVPRKHQNLCNNLAGFEHQSKVKFLMHQVEQYFDPINLLNHSYFKFFTHSIIYLLLKWFQPFEIKISPNLYVKTTC